MDPSTSSSTTATKSRARTMGARPVAKKRQSDSTTTRYGVAIDESVNTPSSASTTTTTPARRRHWWDHKPTNPNWR